MIGCGGGTLGKILAESGRRVLIVDIDKTSFKSARRFFKLPKNVQCQVEDGLEFLRRTRQRFDVIIIDVFVGEKFLINLPMMTFAELLAKVSGRKG